MSKHILLVDDDALMRRSLAFNLDQSGYRVSTSASAEDAIAFVQRDAPDLVLLDITLPEMDGLQALRHLQQFTSVPVIFVTARRDESDQVLGLELGADDYVTKPFAFSVLLARIRSALRRYDDVPAPRITSVPLTLGDLTINPLTHQVSVGGRYINLTPREFDLLYVLALEPGRVFSVDELLSRVWGAEYEGESQAVYVHIRWLREKLEADPSRPSRILTVRGFGYKLASPES